MLVMTISQIGIKEFRGMTKNNHQVIKYPQEIGNDLGNNNKNFRCVMFIRRYAMMSSAPFYNSESTLREKVATAKRWLLSALPVEIRKENLGDIAVS